MSLIEDLTNLFAIHTHCIWIDTIEEQKAINAVYAAIQRFDSMPGQQNDSSNIYEWSCAHGGYKCNSINHEREYSAQLESISFSEPSEENITEFGNQANDLFSTVEAIQKSSKAKISFFIVKEIPSLSNNYEEQRAIRDIKECISVKTDTYAPIIVIAPHSNIPESVSRVFSVLKLSLPTRADITGYIQAHMRQHDYTMSDEDVADIAQTAAGLSTMELLRAFDLSYQMYRSLKKEYILREKIQIIQKSGILTYKEPMLSLDDIGGHDKLKKWIRDSKLLFSEDARKYGVKAPVGFLALGYAGSGKTAIAEAIANYFGIPFVILDLSKIMGGIVGESEQTTRRAFETIEAIGRCVVLIDEAEKQLGGKV